MKPSPDFRRGSLLVALLAAAAPIATAQDDDFEGLPPTAPAPTEGAAADADELPESLARMVLSEDLIRDLTKRFRAVDRAIYNFDLVASEHPTVFADRMVVQDVEAPADAAWRTTTGAAPTRTDWAIEKEAREVDGEGLRLFGAMTDAVGRFDHAHFKFVRGDFDEDASHWVAQVGFYGIGYLPSGESFGFKSDLEIEFTHAGDRDAVDDWRAVRWTVLDASTYVVAHRYFEDVLDTLVEDGDLLHDLRRSYNQEKIVDIKVHGAEEPELFEYGGLEQHPGVTAVDIDRDGWEDLFVQSRWGRAHMLRNVGGGRFVDIAPQIGLDIEGACASASFADFDNDGDVDAMIGRNRLPSLYLVNENGRFVDRTASHVEGMLPGLVSSVSVVDYDGDGLLDVYFGTYSAQRTRVHLRRLTSGKADRRLAELGLVDEADYEPLEEKLRANEVGMGTFDFPGFPNVLLKGVGDGRFVQVKGEPGSPGNLFKNTFSGSWSDFDGDGDQDLFCANDFASDNLFRNDGGTFVDVTDELLGTGPRFGMGVSWGDWNGDGRMDAYVSNMFSKAGNRIISQLDPDMVDPRLLPTAKGNTLLRNDGDRFVPVSDDDTTTSKSGWSYGSQFADVDGDGHLDILGMSGHFTAPDPLANGDDW